MQHIVASLGAAPGWWGALPFVGRSLLHVKLLPTFYASCVGVSTALLWGLIALTGSFSLMDALLSLLLAACWGVFISTMGVALCCAGLVCWRNACLLDALSGREPLTPWMIALAQTPPSPHPLYGFLARGLGRGLFLLLAISTVGGAGVSVAVLFAKDGLIFLPWALGATFAALFSLGIGLGLFGVGARAGQLAIAARLEHVRQRRTLSQDEAKGALALSDEAGQATGSLCLSDEPGQLKLLPPHDDHSSSSKTTG